MRVTRVQDWKYYYIKNNCLGFYQKFILKDYFLQGKSLLVKS